MTLSLLDYVFSWLGLQFAELSHRSVLEGSFDFYSFSLMGTSYLSREEL